MAASRVKSVTRSDTELFGVGLSARWQACDESLRTLALGLEQELLPLLSGRELPIPARKARLTRIGGRCAADGTPLAFDPWRPHDHVCPTCSVVHRGIEHDDWWAMSAQLWCAERTLHAALLGCMWQRDDLMRLAADLMNALSARYLTFPNEDNALGPTRPFFSTYLESVWLLNLTLAAQVLRHSEHARAAVDTLCERVVEPSRSLIASFPEGRSNRQTWHTSAQIAAAQLLGDSAALAPLIDGTTGVHTLLRNGLLEDGSWYEGENYHLFAHRGLWYGVTMLESAGVAIPESLNARFNAGFVTPLLGILPDGTFPSRRDSRYGVSVHQWRFAEWCELGLARADQPTLRTWLHRLYNSEHTSRSTDRACSTADIERDAPPSALHRHDLGWRTLLCARAESWPAPDAIADQSVVLEAQGLTVIRRDTGRIYVALEGGNTGGGHGHPDRLALTIQDGHARVLEDPGAGSYVERSLHWYRSTLAHNAPLVNGRSQVPVPTTLRAFDARDDLAWMQAEAEGIAADVRVVRTVIVSAVHIVEHVEWWSPRTVTLDLPVHFRATLNGAREWHVRDAGGAGGLEDGFDFLTEVRACDVAALDLLAFEGTHERNVKYWCAASANAELFHAVAPGPPRTPARSFLWVRHVASHGWVAGVWSLRNSVAHVAIEQPLHDALEICVRERTGATRRYRAHSPTWQVTEQDEGGVREIPLKGQRSAAVHERPAKQLDARPHHAVDLRLAPARFALGEAHYRGSETDWRAAGQPSADVRVAADNSALHITVRAFTGEVVAPAAGEENALDNERADVNADGVQCYVGPVDRAEWSGAWLLVPDVQTGAVRVTSLVPDNQPVVARWAPAPGGFTLELTVARHVLPENPANELRFDLLVNERPAHRQRRRGQLVLSGSNGETVYLRGDRHDPLRAWRMILPSVRASDSTLNSQA